MKVLPFPGVQLPPALGNRSGHVKSALPRSLGDKLQLLARLSPPVLLELERVVDHLLERL